MSIEAGPGRSGALRAPTLLDALIPLVTFAVLIAGALALSGLSRVAAYSGRGISPLVPWHSCVIYGFTGFKFGHVTPAEEIA